jgi:phage tail protein X
MGFPSFALSFWYDILSGARMTRGQAGIDAFRNYLNNGTNPVVRFYVDGTSGWGHQTSSALLIRNLCRPVGAAPPGFGYTGLIEAYLDDRPPNKPYATTRKKMFRLLGFVPDGDGPYPLNGATVQFFPYPANPPAPPVNLGFTGGADLDEHYAANLNTSYFLRIQPYRWQAAEQVQFASPKWPYVELGDQFVLGYHTFEERAYLQPVVQPVWGNFAADQQAQIVQWLTDPAQTGRFDLCPLYSVRYPGHCELGVAGEVLIVALAGILAAEQKPAGRPVVVVNLDSFESDATDPINNFARIQAVLSNAQKFPFEREGPNLTARRNAFAPLNAANRLQFLMYDPGQGNNLALLQQAVNNWLVQGPPNRVLFVQLARATVEAINPLLFAWVYNNASLPGIFEGQNTANLALNIGKPYFHVNRPRLFGTEQYPSDILSEYYVPPVAQELQRIADRVVTWLAFWPLAPPDPVTVIGNFVQTYRTEGLNGQFHTYFNGIRTFYNIPTNDKFNISVCFLNYLINGRAAALAAAAGAGGDTLDAIYQSFSTAAGGGQPVPFRQQLNQGAQIASFIGTVEQKFGQTFITTGTTVTADKGAGGDIGKVTVAGSSALFGTDAVVKVAAEFTAPDGIVILTCRFTGPVVWRPDGLPWIGFADPYIEFTVADADLLVAGKLGGTLLGPDIEFYAILPPSNGSMLFAGNFLSPPSIDKFYQLAGGISLAASLPPPLDIIASLELRHVEFAVAGTSIGFMAFLLVWKGTAGQGWHLLPNVTLDEIDILIAVTNPGVASSVKANLSGQFTIGTGSNPGVIGVRVNVPDLSFDAQLIKGEILLTDLLGMFLPGVTLNPPSQPSITQFALSGAQKTGDFSLSCQLGFNWKIPSDSLALLEIEYVGLIVNRTGGVVTGQLSGGVTLLPNDHDNSLTLVLTAAYLGAAQGWEFSGKQVSDEQQLSLLKLMGKYLGGWQPPADFGINGIHFSSKPNLGTYTVGGKTAQPWPIPFLDDSPTVSASLELSYDKGYSGNLKATIKWNSIQVDIGCLFGPKQYVYTLDWGHLHAEVAQNEKKQWVATGSLKNLSLGEMIESFISFATGSSFGLSAPWNVLNSVPLDVFEVTFNFTTDQVGFLVNIGPIDLGFCKIESISVTYDASTDRKVLVSLNGSFAWQSGNSLSWDATKPEQTPAPPGGGNEFLDLRLLALGQQVGIVGYQQFTSVQQAITALRALGPDGAPISGPNKNVTFDPTVSWLAAADFGLMKIKKDGALLADAPPQYTVSLALVFADPNLYALRLQLAGPAAKVLDGLAFEVLYRKISDTVGVYQAEITLPTAMRQIDVGAYSITFPIIAVAVYTNGDFTIDIGFPWKLDFTRSFTVQAIIFPGIPVMGSAGFYFGKLSSATSTQVPQATDGQFNPVIIFGFGVQIGIGKSVDYGILKAGFSLTAFGVIQGVIAKWCPNQIAAPGEQTQLQSSYYFWLQGTFGIIGKLFGSVDFAVVKASVNVAIKVYAQITYESYHDIPISVIASVDVTASLEINLGLFSITIHFSFSLTIKETFTISNSGTPPWHVPATVLRGSLTARHLRGLRARRRAHLALAASPVTFTWTNLAAAATPQPLTGYLAPAITVSGDMAAVPSGQKVCFVTVMAIESSDPTEPRSAGAADNSFDLLAKQVLRWIVAASLNPAQGPYTAAQIDTTVVSDDNLASIIAALSNASDPLPIPPDQVDAFLTNQFLLNVTAPVTAGKVDAAPFPISPELTLNVPGTEPALSYTFGAFNSTTPGYLETLRTYFDELAVQVEKESKPKAMAAVGGPAVGTFVFSDYFRLIGRQMVESARDALRDYKYALSQDQAIGDIVTWATGNGAAGFDSASLLEANADHPLAAAQPVTIQGAVTQAAQDATFESIAQQYKNLFTGTALALFNGSSTNLLRAGAQVAYLQQPAYPVEARDSLNTVAVHFGVPLSTLLTNAPGILTQKGLIAPLAVVALPKFVYTTGASDAPGGIAGQFGIPVAALAISANDGVLYSSSIATLDLPHLPQLMVGPLLDEIARTNGLSRISGMAGRYALHGLRLPTAGITPNQPCTCGSPLPSVCGLYALTGQQFALPALAATGSFSFALQLPASAKWWMSFSGASSLTVAIQSGDANDDRWAQIQALQAFFNSPQYQVAPPGTSVGPEPQYRDQPTTWPATSVLEWQTSGSVKLPYGTPPVGVQQPRLWTLPPNLYNLEDARRAAPPRVLPVLGTYDEASGKMVETPLTYYGWATNIGFSIKQVPPTTDSQTGAYTYELVGSGEADILLLERLLAALNGQSGKIASLTLLYAPDATTGAPKGMQSDDSASVTQGILQANLSTETYPPGGSAIKAAFAGGLNSAYDFVKLLWECSITRSGGYYLYYFNEAAGGGFPSRIFNDKNEAVLSLLILSAAADNLLPGYVNCLATGDPFEMTNAAVFAQSAPVATTYPPTSADSLDSIAYRYYMDPVALAEANPAAVLANNAKLQLARGLYEVGPSQPGGDPAAIAAYFGTTLALLQSANPQIANWGSALPLYTALFLPELTITIGTSAGGSTLASLATYYGTEIADIVADNLTKPGLLAAQALQIPGGPLSRSATVPAGCVGIAATRTAPVPPGSPSSPDFARLYIQEQFTLLGYSLVTNAWFGSSNVGLPIGHSDPPPPARAADRTRTPAATVTTPWQFERTVPVSRFALNTPRQALGLPAPDASPYRGVGGLAQLDLGWIDPFGNRIVGQLGDSSLAAPAPLNQPPIAVEYTDALLAVSQWPSIAADYQVLTLAKSGPGIVLTFSLDTNPYSPPSKGWQDKAAQVLPVYDRLYYQLATAISITLETTLLAGSGLPFTTQRQQLADWLFGANGVYAFLVARSQGNSSAAPPDDLPLEFPFTLSQLNPAELFELNVAITLARPARLVEAAFLDAPGFAAASTPVSAHQAQNTDGAHSLVTFAQDLEACLVEAGVCEYKLMSGIDRNQAVQAGEDKPLWIIRLGLAAGQGIHFSISDLGVPSVYAPRPLYNSLQSRPSVNYYKYVSGVGIDFSQPTRTLSFTGIDLDVWMRQVLLAVDSMFSPEFLTPTALVDQLSSIAHRSWIPRLRDAKASLADSLSKLVIAVYEHQTPVTDSAAQEAFKQQLLVALSNAYTVDAVVRCNATVDANIPGDSEPPQLYGGFLPAADSDPGTTVTTAKLALANGSQALTFLVSATGKDPSGAMQGKVTLDLTYRGFEIEHQIGELPNIKGYKASSWLSFVLPPAPTATDWPLDGPLASFDIPLPLRVFPTPPTMVSQTAVLPTPVPPVNLEELIQWNYDIGYSEDFHYPQDTTFVTATFNVMAAGALAQPVTVDPFPDLAEFVTVYPDLHKDLNGILAPITQLSPQSAIDEAGIAVNAFVEITERVADSLAKFLAPSSAGLGQAQAPYTFAIAESASQETNPDSSSVEALLVSLTPPPPAGIGDPVVTVAGYRVHASKTTKGWNYLFTDTAGNYLPAATGQAIAGRTVELPGLNILAAQFALSSAYVERNANLVHGKTIASPFIYQTDPVAFATALRPTLDVTDEIDIASIGSAKPVKRTLTEQLDNLFSQLFANAPAGSQTVQFTAFYRVTLNSNLSEVSALALPIYFLPPTPFLPSGTSATVLTQAQLVALLNSGVVTWFDHNGPAPKGDLLFNLTVMGSAFGANPMPLLILENLVLHYNDWKNPPVPHEDRILPARV